jgi:hypothetical protein
VKHKIVPKGEIDGKVIEWGIWRDKGRVIESNIQNIPFEEFELSPLHLILLNEVKEGWSNYISMSNVEKQQLLKYTYCEIGRNGPPQQITFIKDLKEKVRNGTIKVGDKGDCLYWGNGFLFMDTFLLKSLTKTHIGENLQIVKDILQNLNSSFLDDWEVIVDEHHMVNTDQTEEGYTHFIMEDGECLNVINKDIGRLRLVEHKDSTENEIWIEVIEVWGKRTLNGVEKDKVGKSLLTILSRITKGLDIILKLNVGNVSRVRNHTPYVPQKLTEYYERNGFKVEKTTNRYLIQMSNEEIVEEYWRRMEEEGKFKQ